MGAIAGIQKTVLVVEDSADDLFLLQNALKKSASQLRYRFVRDGESALAYMKGEPPYSDREANPFPNLILLDLALPKLDGFEVMRWIRTTPGCENLIVFVLTGWDHPGYESRAKALGAARVVVKPNLAEGLIDLFAGISKVLAGDQSSTTG